MDYNVDISVVVPLLNEEESLQELTDWVKKVCENNGYSHEMILIDDGSKDKSWEKIVAISKINPCVKGIKFRRNYGKSAALNRGFEAVRGRVTITMDADLQDIPDEIPSLYKKITEEGFDLVSGWKQKRQDPITKTVPTKLFNWATRMLSGIKLHDFNCGLKAYNSDVVKNIEVYGEMHRYIPVIAKWAGFEKIGEQEVEHRARKYGVTKFGLERFVNGFLDLATITFISRFGKKPMHLFGILGSLVFILGFFIFMWLGIEKLFINQKATLLAENSWFFVALTSMIFGVNFFLAGFLGELIARNSPDRNNYKISEKIGIGDDIDL
ncbi:MAG: glycosyltransferase involved in cell wall biosynthesis [Parvicellaceae bacterium]|jgi:glycosyltransferase involved in cell wall biosynthesis